MAGRLVVSLGGSFFCGAWGGAFWLVFSYGIIGRVIRVSGEALVCVETSVDERSE